MNTYRFGFNGMEKDDEVKGSGNSYTTLYRENDVRLGRWFSVDPMESEMPYQSPFTSMDNNPISKSDPNGDVAGIDNVIAGVASGVAEYATQVTTNYLEGKSNPWTSISLGKVGLATVAGGLSDGLSESATFAKLGANIAKIISKASPYVVDALKSTTNQVVTNLDKGNSAFENFSVLKVVEDVAVSKVTGVVSKKIIPKIEKVDVGKIEKTMQKNIDKVARKVANKNPILKTDNAALAAPIKVGVAKVTNTTVVQGTVQTAQKYVKNQLKKGYEAVKGLLSKIF